ncbi:MAG TPA: hypothetical protein VJ890_25710, partial [Vineibacter sp.]|nr:hypothetical protein [Vineibacter sp.]
AWGPPQQQPRWDTAPPRPEAPPEEEAQPRTQPRLRRSLPPEDQAPAPQRAPARRSDSVVDAMTKTAARTVTNVVVREATKAIFGRGGIGGSLVRGVLGGLLK